MYQTSEFSPAMAAGVGAGIALYSILFIALWVIQIIAYWRIFEKAGEEGWKAIIPIYSTYVLFRIAWDVKAFWITLILSILTAIPFVGFLAGIACAIVGILFYVKLAKAFGHGGGFAVGLIFLSTIFILILGFEKSEYLGPQL